MRAVSKIGKIHESMSLSLYLFPINLEYVSEVRESILAGRRNTQ